MNFQIAPLEKLNRLRLGELPADPYRFPFWKPEDSEPASENTEQSEPQQMATDVESPPVIESHPRDIAEEIAELCAPISAYLDALVIDAQPDDFERGYSDPLSTAKPAQSQPSPEVTQFEERKAALLRDLGTWKNALQKLLEDHRSWITAELRADHEIAWREAREQKAVVTSLVTQMNEGSEEIRRAKAELSKARVAVNANAADKPDLSRLPTQGQIDSWVTKDAELRSALQLAEEALDKALEGQRARLREYERGKIALAKSLQREADLRRRLRGDAASDVGLRSESL